MYYTVRLLPRQISRPPELEARAPSPHDGVIWKWVYVCTCFLTGSRHTLVGSYKLFSRHIIGNYEAINTYLPMTTPRTWLRE